MGLEKKAKIGREAWWLPNYKGIELENDIHRLCCLGYKIDIDGDNEEFWV